MFANLFVSPAILTFLTALLTIILLTAESVVLMLSLVFRHFSRPVALARFVLIVYLAFMTWYLLTDLNYGYGGYFTSPLADSPIPLTIPTIPITIAHTIALGICLRSLQRAFDDLHHRPNRLAIKESLDLLPDGIAFVTEDGDLELANQTMENLVGALGVSLAQSPSLIRKDLLKRGSSIPNSKDVAVTLDEKTWLFQAVQFTVGVTRYYQILAFDMTQEANLNRELREESMQIEKNTEQLKGMLTQVEEIERLKVILESRANIHDQFGQRLAIVHRFLEEGDLSNERLDTIRELLKNLNEVFKPTFKDPAAELQNILGAFSMLDFTPALWGSLPRNQEVANVFVQLIREGLTNALRHGKATSATIRLQDTERAYRLRIENSGIMPTLPIKPGNGLISMEFRLSQLNGTLSYAIENGRFVLSASVPKDIFDDEPL